MSKYYFMRKEGEKMNAEMINEGKLVIRIGGRVTRAPTLSPAF